MARKLVTPVQARRGFGFIDIQPDGSVQFNPDVGLSNRGPFPVIDVDSYTFPPASQWGITDETAGVQAALNAAAAASYKATVRFSSRPYKVEGLIWPTSVIIQGAGGNNPFPNAPIIGTVILGTSGYDVFTLEDATNGWQGGIMRGLTIQGGNNGISCLESLGTATHLTLKDTAIKPGAGYAGIYVAPVGTTPQGIERWYLENVSLGYGGGYGFRFYGPNPGQYIDKCVFNNVMSDGPSINCWRIETHESSSLTWINPWIESSGQDGFYFDGGINGWVIINPNSELIGESGAYVATYTTGSITAGSTSLNVVSIGSMAATQNILVAGAGPNGTDLLTTIASVSGLVVTLATAAGTTVANAYVNTGQYDVFRSNSTIAGPVNIVIVGGLGAGTNTLASTRYYVNGTNANAVQLLNTNVGLPSYLGGNGNSVLGGQGPVRMPGPGQDSMNQLLIGNPGLSQACISSPAGQDIILKLLDSTQNFAGSLGYVRVRRADPNRSEIFRIDSEGAILPWTAVAPLGGIYLIPDGTTTPSLQNNGWVMKTANTAATTITNFLNGYSGQTLNLIFGDALTTIANNATISLAGAANFTGAAGNMITFLFDGAVWQEQYRRTT